MAEGLWGGSGGGGAPPPGTVSVPGLPGGRAGPELRIGGEIGTKASPGRAEACGQPRPGWGSPGPGRWVPVPH